MTENTTPKPRRRIQIGKVNKALTRVGCECGWNGGTHYSRYVAQELYRAHKCTTTPKGA